MLTAEGSRNRSVETTGPDIGETLRCSGPDLFIFLEMHFYRDSIPFMLLKIPMTANHNTTFKKSVYWKSKKRSPDCEGVDRVKFRVIIDKTREEEVVATVHRRTDLIDEIESIILRDERTDALAAYQEDEIRLLDLADIECITANEGKVYAVAEDGNRYLLKKRLYEIEESLPPEFIRINKSSIANRKRIHRFTTAISGAVDVEFKSGFKEYVSRRCFADLKRRYGL